MTTPNKMWLEIMSAAVLLTGSCCLKHVFLQPGPTTDSAHRISSVVPAADSVQVISLNRVAFAAAILYLKHVAVNGRSRRAEERLAEEAAHWCQVARNIDQLYLPCYLEALYHIIGFKTLSEQGILIARAGARQFPNRYEFPFLEAWINYFQLGKAKEAARLYAIAARYPDAPMYTASLAGLAMSEVDDPIQAAEFLEQNLRWIENPRILELGKQRALMLRSAPILEEYHIKCTQTNITGAKGPSSAWQMFLTGEVRNPPYDLLGDPIHLDFIDCQATSRLVEFPPTQQ